MQANTVNQNFTAKVISVLQPARWGNLLHSVAVVTTLGVACLTVANPAFGRPTEAEVKDVVRTTDSIVSTLTSDVRSYAQTIEPLQLTRDYYKVPASELPVVLLTDLNEFNIQLKQKLSKLEDKLSWKFKEEIFGNVLIWRNAEILADKVKSYVPRERKVTYIRKLQYFLKASFAKAGYVEDSLFIKEMARNPANLHLPKDWVLLSNYSGVGKVSYQVSPDYIRKLGTLLYASDKDMAHNLFGFIAIASAINSYSNLLMQRYMQQYVLQVWLSDVVLKSSFKKFYEEISPNKDPAEVKLDLVEFLDFAHDLKKTLGSDLFVLTDSTIKQPYTKLCIKDEDKFLHCLTDEWKQQLKDAYHFAELVEEHRALWAFALDLGQVLREDPNGMENGKSEVYVKHRSRVLQALQKYKRDVNRIRLNLLNITR